MRILSFFVLACVLAVAVQAEPIFSFAEVKETTSLTVPADSEKENAVGSAAGMRLVFGKTAGNLDARTYVTLPKTKSSGWEALDSPADFFALWNEPRYGAGVTLGTAFPVTVRGGMLSFSRSITRLKNPTPSAGASPLTKSFGFSAGIGANLPTLSSAVKPLALFASVSVPEQLAGIPIVAQFAFDDEKTALASAGFSARISKFMSVQSALTAGRFLVEADSTTRKLLADTNAAFGATWLYAASLESAFRSPFLKANLLVGFHQMPFSADFSSCAVWIKVSARTTWRNLLLDLSYFTIPTLNASPKPVPLIGGGSSVCRTISQVGINPQVQFSLDNAYVATLRLGFHALAEKKILNTREAEQYSTLKWNAGVAYESKPFTAKVTAGATNVLLDGRFLTNSTTPDEYYSFAVSTSFALEQVRASFSVGYDRYPTSVKTGATKDSISVDASASPGKARMVTLTSGFSASYKNGEKSSSTADASATVTLKSRWVRTTIKCAVSVPL